MTKLAILGGEPINPNPVPAYNTIGDDEKQAVMEVLDSGELSGFVAGNIKEFWGGKKVRELEELLGVDQTTVFKTNDLEVFKDDLSNMTLTDMQALAVEAGVFPSGNRSALKQKLVKEFVSQTKGRRYATGEQKPIIDPSDPQFDKVKKLMSEGF